MPTVAIVGRPNVGKSALFNRLAGRRIAIVHDQPGVTRDRISAPCHISEQPCTIIDTGGIGATLDDGFGAAVTTEADIAMQTADLILFIVDAKDGITVIDEDLAKRLRKSKAPVQLIINKADNEKQDLLTGDFATLGYGEGIPVSAELGKNMHMIADAIDKVVEPLNRDIEEAEQVVKKEGLKIAIVGKPNAGKSSLINAILKDDRTIVSDVSGTTRDAIDVPYEFLGEQHTLIDTAGIRRRTKMDSSVEVFSSMRAERSIRRADICLLVIDCAEGVSAQDRKIARIIQDEKKPCLIVLNKFDLFHPNAQKSARLEEATEHVRTELFFLAYAPYVCVSALKKQSIGLVFSKLAEIRKAAQNPITTGKLNRFLGEAFAKKPPQAKKGTKRLKLLYATAAVNDRYTAIPVPTYILFVNDKRLMQEHYEQYLTNRLREDHPSPGIPITFSVRSRNATDEKKRR
ncbi:ribosome biogenesis GTPase Der [Verrucomicrobiaceae bacterium R5-34]|uniref:GTPase Der n=1 Tax=Oceaniferula flava TaxID=2800421 RepID=A0AAE2SGE2_9BACT|nr:ribosome biogenesis GTPase Der [Oceaniferula flavus]MBK1829797.1 ribosome biogenesis GTPase Der [Verrucomicrobiaceae bacterium R5-34]MBK1856397.1 ribosome biogenesis GTPase Der [Oceaniferula flavus]MBM1137704.1 ribosome biogenesis GTPase Der [Oceaniferula flavus]